MKQSFVEGDLVKLRKDWRLIAFKEGLRDPGLRGMASYYFGIREPIMDELAQRIFRLDNSIQDEDCLLVGGWFIKKVLLERI